MKPAEIPQSWAGSRASAQHHEENGGKVRVLEQDPEERLDFSLCCRSVRISAAIVAAAGPFRGYFGIGPMFFSV